MANIIKAMLGIMKWKRTMKKCADMKPYSDEWWRDMTDALAFLPEDQREGFMDAVVGAGCAF